VGVDALYETNRPHVIAEAVDEEVVAINLDSGCYYSIRGLGAPIWLAIERRASIEHIAARLASRWNAEPPLEQAVADFLAELEREGLARPAAANDRGPDVDGEAVVASEDAASPLDPPVMEKFTDMEELLLLDPVHDVDAQGWPHVAPGG
jgi:hypothetical protein